MNLAHDLDFAESIAFYNGEKHEETCATLRLALLVAVTRIKIIWSTFLALWTNFYQHATILLPSILTAPRYFDGEVEFGVITQVNRPAAFILLLSMYLCSWDRSSRSLMPSPPLQVSFAFSRIESALNYILSHLQELSGLAAEAERLEALLSGAYPHACTWSLCIDICSMKAHHVLMQNGGAVQR